MQRPSSFVITCGLASALAVGLWLWQRDDPPTTTDAASVAPAGMGARRLVAGTDPGAMASPSRAGHAPVAVAPTGDGPRELPPFVQPERLPEAAKRARVEAFRGWHDDAQRQLMTCLPAWTEAGEPRPVRVRFSPGESTGDEETEASTAVVRADMVEPLEPDVEVPVEVRKCLDRLLGMEIELPEEATETQHGHQEIIHVMWG